VFGVTRDAYYKKLKRRNTKDREEAVVLKLVDRIREDEPRVGTRKLQDRLIKSGKTVGRDFLFSLLKKTDRLVKPKKSFEKTTYSDHGYAVAPNRIKELVVTAPKQVLVTDITYIRMAKGEFAYLFLVTDKFSRRIVGYHISRDLTHYSALLALDNAVRLMGDVTGTIHHSDRGCQYCCHEFLKYLGEHEMLSSMTDESHCYQNAIAERVNGILKDEFNLDAIFANFMELQLAVTKAILVYNTKRTHWSLGLRTPVQVYEEAA
jgi:transposase InsO family protein